MEALAGRGGGVAALIAPALASSWTSPVGSDDAHTALQSDVLQAPMAFPIPLAEVENSHRALPRPGSLRLAHPTTVTGDVSNSGSRRHIKGLTDVGMRGAPALPAASDREGFEAAELRPRAETGLGLPAASEGEPRWRRAGFTIASPSCCRLRLHQ